MRALVTVKRVLDPYATVRFKKDLSGIDTQNMKMSMNPFDEIALEEAVRLKEKGMISEITAITIGAVSSQETLRHALAFGADKAVFIEAEQHLSSFQVALILKTWMSSQNFDCVFMGKQAIDGDNNQTPQILAALLDWPQATFASLLNLQGDTLQVTREVDSGLEILDVTLPAVVSVDLRLNQPRYVSLPNIMLAKKKTIECIPLTALDLVLPEQVRVVSVKPPPARSQAVIKIDSVEALVDKLRHEAKVLSEEAL